ncbi:MAG: hypothetical protein IPJ89_03710 [Candidatus Iainarchaeum archaeon]|uniref:Uncharacterized protein n=1 Tax=Candidatus Iainarchaeum sp. TaxID=3101447 RepID=A0A7T9I1B4_9ARCH|nr:MAG: hypothetical protein IPJ89_03710 [Candidatus Diapherotrites archaeon]
MDLKLINYKKFNELHQILHSQSTLIESQISAIDSDFTGLIVGSVLSLILGLGISIQLQIITFWVPTLFLLLFLFGIWGFYSTYKNVKSTNSNEFSKIYNSTDHRVLDWQFIQFAESINPFINGMILLHFVALMIMIWLIQEKTYEINVFMYYIGYIILNIYGLFSFSPSIVNMHQSGKLKESLAKTEKYSKAIKYFTYFYLLIILVFSVIFPIIIFFHSLNLFSLQYISGFFYLFFTLLIQLLFLAISASYISALNAKVALVNIFSNYYSLIHQLNKLYLSNELNEVAIDEIVKNITDSNKRILRIRKEFMFFNFYGFDTLIPKSKNK